MTSGERICAVTWMQSRLRDPAKRALVSEYRNLLDELKDNPDLFLRFGRIHSALLRRWTER